MNRSIELEKSIRKAELDRSIDELNRSIELETTVRKIELERSLTEA